MQIIKTGTMYNIYNSDIESFNTLPPKNFLVGCCKTGFYLEEIEDFQIKEKIYGNHQTKVEKTLSAFKVFTRNLGVILSGDKGMGKSIFAKLLAITAQKNGLPTIIVNNYYAGIADFLNSINQEAVVIFDEFDKTFNKNNHSQDNEDPQTEMLTLFDGLNCGKKLFVITCNDFRQLNEYLINRPGRFHYHFRFEYPSEDEIKDYLKDNIPSSMYSEIPYIVQFAQKVSINYDCLRSIAFELTQGNNFKSFIGDLNIINTKDEAFILSVVFEDGTTSKSSHRTIDMFSSDEITVEFTSHDNYLFYVTFNPSVGSYNSTLGQIVVTNNDIGEVDWEPDYYDSNEEEIKKCKERSLRKIKYIVMKKKCDTNIHYAL